MIIDVVTGVLSAVISPITGAASAALAAAFAPVAQFVGPFVPFFDLLNYGLPLSELLALAQVFFGVATAAIIYHSAMKAAGFIPFVNVGEH
jgi:hypothetical protein